MAGYPNYDDLYNQIIGGDRDLALTITMDFMILLDTFVVYDCVVQFLLFSVLFSLINKKSYKVLQFIQYGYSKSMQRVSTTGWS